MLFCGLEARETVDYRKAYDGSACRNQRDRLPKLTTTASAATPQLDAEVDEAEEANGAPKEGNRLYGEPNKLFQCPITTVSFLF